jgi:hypothetical protein
MFMDYKQQSNQGCLVVDLHYLFQETPSRQNEAEILMNGLFKFRDNYTMGCLMAFLDKHPAKKARIYFDNKYYLNTLKQKISHPQIDMVFGKNDLTLINSLPTPFIVYVDTNILEVFSHLPHFIMVTKSTEKRLNIYDPWDGKTKQISKDKLLTGINLLRNHIKICPFIITRA